MDLGFVDHDQVAGRQGRILQHRARRGVLLVEVGDAPVAAVAVAWVRRPEHRAAVPGVAEPWREAEMAEIRALQNEGVAMHGAGDLVRHRHPEIEGARPSHRQIEARVAGAHDRRVLVWQIVDRGRVRQRLVTGHREHDVGRAERGPGP
ncbi:MAG: hypothetical protein ACHP84_06455 [Caulobacterales bacterium]